MNTDQLIRNLAHDHRRQGLNPERMWSLILPLAVVAAAAMFTAVLGPRSDFLAAIQTPRFVFKFVLMGALLVAAMAAVMESGRPDGRVRWLAFAPVPILVAGAIVAELLVLPSASWVSAAIGSNWLVCLVAIPSLGLGPLCLAIIALRRGAPVRPLRAGALAGILAGSIAAFFYAAHCTDDSPLFVTLWYSAAILILATLGAMAGRLFLRW